MIRIKRTAWAVGLAGIFGLLFALATAAQAEQKAVKIGLVDVDQALNATEEGKAAREEFSRKARAAQAEIEPMLTRFQSLQEELKSKKYVLSDEALSQKQFEILELRNKLQAKRSEIEGQLKIEQGKMIKPLTEKLRKIVEDIGKEQGFTLIIQRNSPMVMYSREALDITDLVVARFNKQG